MWLEMAKQKFCELDGNTSACNISQKQEGLKSHPKLHQQDRFGESACPTFL